MKILLAQCNFTVGDLKGNVQKIIRVINNARELPVEIVLFSELSLCGYPPEDLLVHPEFIQAAQASLEEIIPYCIDIIAILGMPRQNPNKTEKKLFNSAAIIQNQRLIGFQDKSLLPTYDVFDERRYFEPASGCGVWNLSGKRIAITICEDIWQHSGSVKYTSYRHDPILDLKQLHPDLVLNLSASPYSIIKHQNRVKACQSAAISLGCPLLLCNQVGGNDSLIFDGKSVCVDAKGQVVAQGKGFEEDLLVIDLAAPHPALKYKEDPIEDLYRALVLGVRDYFQKLDFNKACLGLSGGIDSALVACIAVDALGAENVLGIGMPSRFSSEGSRSDAMQLAKTLGMQYKEIPIEKPFESYLELLEPHFENRPFDVAEENLQARIRGMILMAVSNKLGYIVLSTGNKSEMAMGYATLYGDMCGGLGVINDVSKTQVYALANWINRKREIIPKNTILKPPSAELRPNQRDQDSLPDYAIVDKVLSSYVEELMAPEEIAEKFDIPSELVHDLVRRIHRNEYKRRQSPPGLRVSEKAFSVGRHFPIVERWVSHNEYTTHLGENTHGCSC